MKRIIHNTDYLALKHAIAHQVIFAVESATNQDLTAHGYETIRGGITALRILSELTPADQSDDAG